MGNVTGVIPIPSMVVPITPRDVGTARVVMPIALVAMGTT
jgi:hypothetical protein